MRGFLGAAAVLVLGAGAFAQDVEIRVDDLLRPSLTERDLRFFPWPDPTGELALHPEPQEPVVPLGGDDLLKAVSFLAGGVEVRFTDFMVHIGCTKETADLVRAAVARLRAQRPGRIDLSVELTIGDPGSGAAAVALREAVEPREWVTVADETARSALTDFDVELAQASEIPDPILEVAPTGAYVRLRVLPLPSSDEAVVEVDAVVVEPRPAEKMLPRWVGMSEMDRLRNSVERFVAPVRVRSGAPTSCEWTGRDGRRVRLALTASWTPAPEDEGAAVVWSPLVDAVVSDFWFIPSELVPAGAEESEEQPRFGRASEGAPFVAVDEVLALQRTEVVASGGTGLRIFRGPGARAARDAVVKRIGETTRAARVSLAVWDVPRGTQVGDDGSVPAGAREVFRATAPALLGHNAVFVAGEGATFLQDWDVEVAVASRIADPIVGVLMTGTFANVLVSGGPGGGPGGGEADLDLTISRLDGMATQVVEVLVPAGGAVGTLELSVPDPSKSGQKTNATGSVTGTPSLMPTSYTIEKPKVARTRVRTRLLLSPSGVAVSRRSVPGLLGGDRELVVVVRAE